MKPKSWDLLVAPTAEVPVNVHQAVAGLVVAPMIAARGRRDIRRKGKTNRGTHRVGCRLRNAEHFQTASDRQDSD